MNGLTQATFLIFLQSREQVGLETGPLRFTKRLRCHFTTSTKETFSVFFTLFVGDSSSAMAAYKTFVEEEKPRNLTYFDHCRSV